jgi:hypothetical protein
MTATTEAMLRDRIKNLEAGLELAEASEKNAWMWAQRCVAQLPKDARFQAACAALQGLLAHGTDDNYEVDCRMACEYADQLLAELNKQTE